SRVPGAPYCFSASSAFEQTTVSKLSRSRRAFRSFRIVSSSSTIMTAGLICISSLPKFPEILRHTHGERGPLSQFRLNFDRALELVQNPVGQRQAQAHSLPDFLGGEEGIENLGFVFLRHSGAVVGHADFDEFAAFPARNHDFSAAALRLFDRVA